MDAIDRQGNKTVYDCIILKTTHLRCRKKKNGNFNKSIFFFSNSGKTSPRNRVETGFTGNNYHGSRYYYNISISTTRSRLRTSPFQFGLHSRPSGAMSMSITRRGPDRFARALSISTLQIPR